MYLPCAWEPWWAHFNIDVALKILIHHQSIGDKWEALGFGAMNKDSSFKLLDAYYEAGGNFIDTANV